MATKIETSSAVRPPVPQGTCIEAETLGDYLEPAGAFVELTIID